MKMMGSMMSSVGVTDPIPQMATTSEGLADWLESALKREGHLNYEVVAAVKWMYERIGPHIEGYTLACIGVKLAIAWKIGNEAIGFPTYGNHPDPDEGEQTPPTTRGLSLADARRATEGKGERMQAVAAGSEEQGPEG